MPPHLARDRAQFGARRAAVVAISSVIVGCVEVAGMADKVVSGMWQPRLELRVADAGLVSRIGRERAAAARSSWPMRLFWVYALINISSFMHGIEVPTLVKIVIIVRYLLWPMVIGLAAVQVAQHGPGTVLRSFAPFSAFLMIGVLSTLNSPFAIESIRLLVFWVLSLLAAILTGLRLPATTIVRTTWATIMVMLVSSALFALAYPALGISADSRGLLGASWRGLFNNKNLFGEICGYGLLFTLIATGIRVPIRIMAGAMAVVLLAKSGSQGALAVAAMVVLYRICVPVVARQTWPVAAKSAVLIATLVSVVGAVAVLRAPLLALLGRDTTLTGRTDIWRQWLARALDHWPIGASPGSFTLPGSPVTADLALSFQRYGSILTPHNMYIAVLGELGVFGLAAFVVPLVAMFAVVPFRAAGAENSSRMPLACGLIAFNMAMGGIGETHEVFGIGLNMTLLTLAYTALLRERRQMSAVAKPGPAARPGAETSQGMPVLA
jgi:O-antigen ligase